MIDFGRLQADIVKNWCKYDDSISDYKSYKDVEICGNTYIPIVYRNYAIYFIPDKFYKLSKEFNEKLDKLKQIIDDVTEADELTVTNNIEESSGSITESSSIMMKKFKDTEGNDIWLDLKLLKPFKDNIKFYGKGDVVLVRDRTSNQPLGIVLAIHRSDNK